MSLSAFFFTSLLMLSAYFLQTCALGGALGQTPPSPELVQMSPGMLRCRAPPGQGGQVFELYHLHTLALSQTFDRKHSHADFQLSDNAGDPKEFYCCRYDLSMFSPYIRLSLPTLQATPPAPLQLSVTPSDGRVRPGQVVEFYCHTPPTLAPVAFVLQKQCQEDENFQIVNYSTNPQFRVGPVGVADGGVYTCFFKLNIPEGIQHSAPSAPVSVIVGAPALPAPRLSQGGQGLLECIGSPSYPGAHFSLFQQGSSLPLATQPANMIQHRVQFTASGEGGAGGGAGGGYQCQYSVLLGKNWEHSELSAPIIPPCVTEYSSCSPSFTDNHLLHTGSMDLALVCGSVSAALLFLMVFIFLAFGIHRYVKKAAKKKREREQQQFWQQVRSRDHVVDLTLQRISPGTKEDKRASVSEPIYDYPLSTFTHSPAY